MGIVYRARNLALDRDRALKVLAPALSADARFRERFRRESRLAAVDRAPERDPGPPGGRGGRPPLPLDAAGRGPRPARAGRRRRPARAGEAAAEVVAAVAGGLDAAHAAGLIHRDVKPANVLVGDGADAGRVYLTDFGISRTIARRRDGDRHRRARRHRRLRRPGADRRRAGRPPRRRLRARRASSTSRSPARRRSRATTSSRPCSPTRTRRGRGRPRRRRRLAAPRPRGRAGDGDRPRRDRFPTAAAPSGRRSRAVPDAPTHGDGAARPRRRPPRHAAPPARGWR